MSVQLMMRGGQDLLVLKLLQAKFTLRVEVGCERKRTQGSLLDFCSDQINEQQCHLLRWTGKKKSIVLTLSKQGIKQQPGKINAQKNNVNQCALIQGIHIPFVKIT